jgi:hypothetical protein
MKPPFCPNQYCPMHWAEKVPHLDSWYKCNGHYSTRIAGSIQTFKCLVCGHSFSQRSFSINYYTKRNLSYKQICSRRVSGENLSAIARSLCCSVDSITNRIERMGRVCLSIQRKALQHLFQQEDIVVAELESFVRSQSFPNNISILIGKDSQFLYGYTHTTVQRKTLRKKHSSKQLQQESCFPPLQSNHNRLFSAHYINRELRKDIAYYHRDRFAFCRNVSNGLLGLAIYEVSHNYIKPFRITKIIPPPPPHAVKAGISPLVVTRLLRGMFRHRAFLSKTEVSDVERQIWLKKYSTPLKRSSDYVPAYATA